MTRIPNNQDLEELFKTSFENFEPEVNVDVWDKIQQNIPKGAMQGAVITSVVGKLGRKLLLGAGAVATVVATVVYFNTTDKATTSVVTNKSVTTTIVAPVAKADEKELVSTNEVTATDKNSDLTYLASKSENKKEQKAAKPEVSTSKVNKQQIHDVTGTTANNSAPSAISKQAEQAIITPPAIAPKTTAAASSQERIQETNTPATDNSVSTNNSKPVIGATSHSGVFPLTITFSNKAGNNINKWDFGDGTFSTEKSPIHTYEKVGIYKVVLTSENNVKDVQFIQVLSNIKVNAPNFFTPDGDGINDEFKVTSNDAESLHVQILDLAGKEVGRIESQEGTWNGKNVRNGEACKSGTYLYVVSGTTIDGKQFEHRGTLTLKR